jgi:hypothetical protein
MKYYEAAEKSNRSEVESMPRASFSAFGGLYVLDLLVLPPALENEGWPWLCCIVEMERGPWQPNVLNSGWFA